MAFVSARRRVSTPKQNPAALFICFAETLKIRNRPTSDLHTEQLITTESVELTLVGASGQCSDPQLIDMQMVGADGEVLKSCTYQKQAKVCLVTGRHVAAH